MSDPMDTQITSPPRPSFLSKPTSTGNGGLKLSLEETSHGPPIRLFSSSSSGDGDEDANMETSGGGIIPTFEPSSTDVGFGNYNMPIDPDASYVISANGTLRAGGFAINKGGIAAQPERRMSHLTPATASSSASSSSASAAARGSFSGGSAAQPSTHSSSSGGGGGYSSLSSAFSTTDGELAFNPNDLVELGAVGKGACGVVKRAMHLPSLQIVALKQINVFDKDKRHQLVKELTALSAVNSPYIVRFMGATFHDGSISIMLQYANRHSLLEMLKIYGAFSEICLQRIALHTFRGLELLHNARVIHRDIKPGNILIDSSFNCCLTDFGVVTALEGTMDLASTIVGTTLFFAPERVTHEGKYSYASDIWSLGVTLYYLAVGVLPYPATGGYWGIVKAIRDDPVPQLPTSHPVTGEKYSEGFRDLLGMCLQKDPIKRPSASVLLQHPFLKNAEGQWETALAKNKSPPHVLMELTENDRSDLDAVLMVLYRTHYGSNRGEYRKSLMELARFQKLAESLNNRAVTVQVVQQRFEELYKKARAEGK